MPTDHDTPDRERQVVELLRAAAASERAPGSLHARIAALRGPAPAGTRRRPLPRPGLVLTRVAMPAAAAAAAVVVLAFGSGAGAPSIAQAAALGARAPSAAAPTPDPSAPARLLSARVGDLHFPNWQTNAGWRSIGQRRDRLGDHSVTTVFYAHGTQRVAYSIVAAPALAGLNTHGGSYATLRQHGRTVIAWEERNHTCVLSATGIAAYELWRLASSGGA